MTGPDDPLCDPNGTFEITFENDDDMNPKCHCVEGFSGETCRNRCPDGHYGEDPMDCKRKITIKQLHLEIEIFDHLLYKPYVNGVYLTEQKLL